MHMYSCINLIKHFKHNNKHKIDTLDRQLIDALVGKYFKYLHLTLMLIIIKSIKPISKYFHNHHGITTVLAKLLKPHNNHIHTGRYSGQVQFRTCKANIHENDMKPEIEND